ncbi:C39 family peptidase [Lysinibacillus irui]|uniref:C39 family peptidase n=1 Tax=Lysinibacillus irui TaxID=2998077 RepID=A0ABU5NQM5_9BACI|nr:C39 family peptidase [Lysinibacillus irui]MEA0556015.1 C39 family peptidase [Lysinibacillus irui]MEA0978269.1 C39 family peptidase [Lysinibacillus irui]MEA1044423.1 C39 family peptidase [Lysinibacillus irui]
MWTGYKRLLLIGILIIMLLSSCQPFSQQDSQQKNQLTVLTVEFNSGAPIPNLYLTITDVQTGDVVEEAIGSEEGEAIFSKLKAGREYAIAATTLENSEANVGYTTIENFTYDTTKPYYRLQTHFSRDEQELDVPVVMQNPELPHGCEITSLTAVLNYFGMNVTKLEMADHYLPKQEIRTVGGKRFGPNPNVAFAGNPRDKAHGMYVFAAPIVKAAEAVIANKQENLRVTNMSQASQADILELVREGVPVVTWVTLDLSKPKQKAERGWIYEGESTSRDAFMNLHAVVLTGHLGDKVVVMDPLKGYVTYNVDQFFNSYRELGKQAVAVHK